MASEIYGHRFDVGNDPEAEIFDPTSSQHFDYNRLYNRDQARFLAADLNGDQKLSKTEWVLFQNPLKVKLKSRQSNHLQSQIISSNNLLSKSCYTIYIF